MGNINRNQSVSESHFKVHHTNTLTTLTEISGPFSNLFRQSVKL